jgi:uncharacterized protein (DUF1015 family)
VIGRIQELMRGRDLIIADGHHRYETALAYRELRDADRTSPDEPFDYTCMYFSSADDPGMAILPTHRKASNLPSYDPAAFLRELATDFILTGMDAVPIPDLMAKLGENARDVNRYGVFTGDVFQLAEYRSTAVPKELDVEILQSVIIQGKLGITPEQIREGKYLHFTQSPDHACGDVRAGKDQVAFLLNPVSTDELFRVVLQGKRLPQKSTYFHPKTVSGMVMYAIDRASL